MPIALRPLPKRPQKQVCAHAMAGRSDRVAVGIVSGFALTLPANADEALAPPATTLSYEDATRAATTGTKGDDLSLRIPDIDLGGTGNALPLVAGLAAGLALAGVATRYLFGGFGGPQLKGIPPQQVLKLLEKDDNVVLVDIRSKQEAREDGVPNLRSAKKALQSIPYQPPAGPSPQQSSGTVSVGWAQRIARTKKISGEGKTIILLDNDGSVAPTAARELAAAVPAVKAIIRVDGGAQRWQSDDLPWKAAPSLPSFSLPKFSVPNIQLPSSSGSPDGGSTIDSGTVAVAGAAAGGLFFLAQVEPLLELIGIAFSIQFVARRLLFADERKKTLGELQGIQKRIAAGDLTTDLRRLADAALEVPEVAGSQDLESAAKDTTQQLAQAASKSKPSTGGASSGAAPSGNGTAKADSKDDEIEQRRKEAKQWIAKWRESSKVTA